MPRNIKTKQMSTREYKQGFSAKKILNEMMSKFLKNNVKVYKTSTLMTIFRKSLSI